MTEHISYSQYNSYKQCPRNWYLSKVVKAEEKQTWYIPIGSAVHEMVEEYLKADDQGSGYVLTRTAEQVFYPLIEKQMLIEPDTRKWMAGGPKSAPIVEELALKRVQDCFERALEFLEEFDVWEVEYDASGHLPGLDPLVKAYVDIIGEHKKKGPTILDWKTGSTKPGPFQLETYAALLAKPNQFWNITANKPIAFQGKYAMLAPGASNARFIDLSQVSPAEVGAKYQAVWEDMQAKKYRADAGFNCRFCFNQENCLLEAGPTDRAKYYDRSSEDGYPF